MTTFLARYDFRAPTASPAQRQELFSRAVQQAAFLDSKGFDALVLSEHHGSPDGYLPSPVPVAAAFAAVTSRIPISISALILNLYDPVRLAEDLAVLDHLSNGRLSCTIGLGYRPSEYALHGRSWETRARDIEERLTALLRAWSDGEVFPAPLSQPHPFLLYGGGTVAAARRAGRFGLHFQPQHDDVTIIEAYVDECSSRGRPPGLVLLPPRGPMVTFCSRDPDRFWSEHGSFLLADAQGYAAWREGDQLSFVADDSSTVEELRSGDVYLVLDPDTLISRCRSGEIELVSSHPCCGGLPAEPSWESLELLTETVLPALRS